MVYPLERTEPQSLMTNCVCVCVISESRGCDGFTPFHSHTLSLLTHTYYWFKLTATRWPPKFLVNRSAVQRTCLSEMTSTSTCS